MGLNVTAQMDKEEILDALEKEANEMNYTIVRDTVEWNPDDEMMVSFELEVLSEEKREAMGMESRSIYDYVDDRIREAIKEEFINLEDVIRQLAESSGSTNDPSDGDDEEIDEDELPPGDDVENYKKRKKNIEKVRQENEQLPEPEDAPPLSVPTGE